MVQSAKFILQITIFLVFISSLYFSCATKKGASNQADAGTAQIEKLAKEPPIASEDPWGDYVLVEGGTFTMGRVAPDAGKKADFDNAGTPRRVTLSSFYLQKYEVTNYEYRQFVNWVRDSIAHSLLGHFMQDKKSGEQRLDWSRTIDWSDKRLEELYPTRLAQEDEFYFEPKKSLNASKLIYEYSIGLKRFDLFMTWEEDINLIKEEIYPDTTAWLRDFPYAYNEPMTRNYFWHPAFKNYPVVGVSYTQALAYCDWKTKVIFKNKYPAVRIPTEAEWEYAAVAKIDNDYWDRGSRNFPWDGSFFEPLKRKRKEKEGTPEVFTLNCNAGNVWEGSGIADYRADGYEYTAPVNSYAPNDFGLYQMAGNVAEWIQDPFDNTGFIEGKIYMQAQIAEKMDHKEVAEKGFWNVAHIKTYGDERSAYYRTIAEYFEMNGLEDYEDLNDQLPAFFFDQLDSYRYTKGGSWADPVFYIQSGARNIADSNLGHSTVGFRTAMIRLWTPEENPESGKKNIRKTGKKKKSKKRKSTTKGWKYKN